MTRHTFTEAQDFFILKHYNKDMTARAIAEELKRKRASIVTRYQYLIGKRDQEYYKRMREADKSRSSDVDTSVWVRPKTQRVPSMPKLRFLGDF